jgi:hypothetical protein
MSLFSDIADVGGKLASSFLTLDDLVAGQGVVGGGLAQIRQAGRLGAGSVLASSNLAARTFQLGVQAGAKTARLTAEAFEGVVPGAGAARKLAEKVDAQAAAAAEEASMLTARCVEMTGGASAAPRNPLTGERWVSKECPPGYTWAELTADTVVGPFGRIAMLPLTMGMDTASAAAATGAGRMTMGATVQAVNGLLDLGSASSKLDRAELRDALMAVSSTTGNAVARDFVAIAEAAGRFTLGDARRLLRGMREGLEELRLIAAHDEMDELLPALPVSATLRRRARKIVDNPPKKFLAAIAERPVRFGKVLRSLIEDAEPLRLFLVNYPQVVTLLGANTTMVLAAGLLDVGEIEDYVRDDGGKGTPWSAVGFEDWVGQAVLGKRDPRLGYYPECAVRYARDVSFLYASEVLGRDKALARVDRLYGKDARDRAAADVSLYRDVLDAEAGEAREERIRDFIADAEDLIDCRDKGQEQLAALEDFAALPFQYVPEQAGERIAILRYFLSRTGQELALQVEGADAGRRDAGRQEAQQAFAKWVDGGARSVKSKAASK